MKLKRMRFSLLSLLGLMAVVGVGLFIWQQWIAWPMAQAEFETICQSAATPETEARFESLLMRYPQLAQNGDAMGWAVAHGNLKHCQMLFERGAPLNEPLTSGGLTPFYYAIEKGHLELISFYLAEGINPTSAESLGFGPIEINATPLHVAAFYGQGDVCHLLIQAGADVNASSTYFQSPLRAALNSGSLPVLELLMDEGGKLSSLPDPPYRDLVEQHVPPNTPREDIERVIKRLDACLPQQNESSGQGVSP